MFGNLAIFAGAAAKVKVDPKDIPPPTPLNIPRFQPFARDDDPVEPEASLSALLENAGRSMASLLGTSGFTAIGLNLTPDATLEQIVPDPSVIPDFDAWEKLTMDDARDRNQSTRVPMRNGNLAPGCQNYLERRTELSNLNEKAFRTVRRIPPPKGEQQARLGNTYEFFRCLEALTTFWDDPTEPPQLPPSPEPLSSEGADTPAAGAGGSPPVDDTPGPIRTATGSSMPPEYRTNLVSAFVKLVAYDFGCNASSARVEPRLHLSSPSSGRHQPRKTFCPSGCHFIFQSPMTREEARAGAVYGPVAAVSSRPTTDFATPDLETAQALDLAREVVAALITAQHRAREGKAEKRFGEGEWWTTKPRWGGGTGGPIGREEDKYAIQGDKDVRPGAGDGMVMMPPTKRSRKTMSIYDNYRMVRAPASTWDRKAHYQAIGRSKGADYDDIFVVSSLFHHVSVLRVRVPARLLEAVEGAPEPEPTRRSWGTVEAWRSPWFDFFDAEQRLEAMKYLWVMMAYQMRSNTGSSDSDVKMANA